MFLHEIRQFAFIRLLSARAYAPSFPAHATYTHPMDDVPLCTNFILKNNANL